MLHLDKKYHRCLCVCDYQGTPKQFSATYACKGSNQRIESFGVRHGVLVERGCSFLSLCHRVVFAVLKETGQPTKLNRARRSRSFLPHSPSFSHHIPLRFMSQPFKKFKKFNNFNNVQQCSKKFNKVQKSSNMFKNVQKRFSFLFFFKKCFLS